MATARTRPSFGRLFSGLVLIVSAWPVRAEAPPVVGLIPKATKPIHLDGKLDDWDGAFVTPVHIGHPDFANRGAEFLFLWDEENLYIGQRCLDRKPAQVAPDTQLWNGDAVEFYLDTRRGADLGAAQFGPGTLHMFWTAFTGTEVKPRLRVRDLPALQGLHLKGAEVAAQKTDGGYTAEFKLAWSNFPHFTPRAGELLGIDCELCSGDGGPRTDRTFVYSSPASVSTPSAFGRVKLVDGININDLRQYSRALLPVSVTQSANYPYVYATAGVSPTLAPLLGRVEGKVIDAAGKVRQSTPGELRKLPGSGLTLWDGKWELFDLPPGSYTVEVNALDAAGHPLATRRVPLVHGPARGGH